LLIDEKWRNEDVIITKLDVLELSHNTLKQLTSKIEIPLQDVLILTNWMIDNLAEWEFKYILKGKKS